MSRFALKNVKTSISATTECVSFTSRIKGLLFPQIIEQTNLPVILPLHINKQTTAKNKER
jgi:hypothetical protein